MDQHETLPATSVSTWSMGLSELAKDRLVMAGLAFGGVLTLIWALVLAMLAWEVWTFMA